MAYKYNPPPGNSANETRDRILLEFARWNDMAGEKVVGNFDFPASAKIAGVEGICRFELRGQPVEIKVDKFDAYLVNFACVALAIQSMRLNEARGIGETMREAYAMLPAAPKHRDPYEVLGVHPGSSLADIEDVYRMKIKRVHPDTAGANADERAAAELNDALAKIREEKR